jgi:DNA repair exonuclease SbcCD nuclease subunit
MTDLHFGSKNNSQQHNEDLQKFFEYVVDYAQTNDINNVIITGDIFQQRDKLDILTITSAMNSFNFLSNHLKIKAIKGNHDLYYRDTRKVSSLDILLPYMDITDFYDIEGDMMYVSWICNQEEYDEVITISKSKKIKYMFGHYEFASFSMNDNYVMEHGHSHKELKHIKKVFTGHYHKRQVRDNVVYVGTPFPYDFNDANDNERGFAVFDSSNGNHAFVNYESVKVLSMTYSEFANSNFIVGSENSSIRIIIDKELDIEELDNLKEKMDSMNFRESKINYKLNKQNLSESDNSDTIGTNIMDIDTAVIANITNMMDVEDIDKEILLELYKGVMQK